MVVFVFSNAADSWGSNLQSDATADNVKYEPLAVICLVFVENIYWVCKPLQWFLAEPRTSDQADHQVIG